MMRLRLGHRRALTKGCQALLLIAVFGSCILFLVGLWRTQGNRVLFDFKGGLYNAGVDILHGHNPYRPGFLAAQAALMRAGGIPLGATAENAFSIPVYPAPANLFVVPLSLLPFWLAGALFTLFSIAAMIGGLRLLGVRDWRCLVVALLSWPVLFSLDLGALGPLLVLGAGVAWRFAKRPDGDAQAFGLAVIAALTASPIVWEHYMVLLFVPIALISPRLSSLWFVPVCAPLVLVISVAVIPTGSSLHSISDDTVRGAVLWLALEAIVVWRLCRFRSAAVGERELVSPRAHVGPHQRPLPTLV